MKSFLFLSHRIVSKLQMPESEVGIACCFSGWDQCFIGEVQALFGGNMPLRVKELFGHRFEHMRYASFSMCSGFLSLAFSLMLSFVECWMLSLNKVRFSFLGARSCSLYFWEIHFSEILII